MNVPRRWLVGLVAALTCVGVGLVAAGFLGFGPVARDGVTETQHQPQVVKLLGEGGDPLVVMIGVTWTKDGYCSGQFEVQATETPTEIRVGTVLSREYANGDCAGIGTDDTFAWAELRLTSPLGERAVVRDSDSSLLPIRAS
jgi:hypothetical protein